jgi:type I restriction enzyme S subunit
MEPGVLGEWREHSLSHVAEVVMGQSPRGSSYNRSGIGCPLINGPTEFTERHPIQIQWTAEPSRFCRPGDLLLCVRGSSTGRTNVADDDYAIGRGIAAIRGKNGNDTAFVSYQVVAVIKLVLAAAAGSTFPSIDGPSLRRLSIAVPTDPLEQAAIAKALSDVDGLIASLDRLIAQKRAIKQAAMQQLLTGKTRLPGFGTHSSPRGCNGGGTPRGWQRQHLGTCGEVVMGQSPPSASYNNLGTGSPLINGPTEFTNRHPIKIQWTTQPTRFCKPGDLLLCVRGSSTGRTNYADDVYAIGRGVATIRAKAGNDTGFISLQTVSQVSRILAAATGSTFPSIDGASLRKLAIDLPVDLAEQRAVAAVLTDMDTTVATLENRRDKVLAVKQGMMQALLTGRIRLPVEAATSGGKA